MLYLHEEPTDIGLQSNVIACTTKAATAYSASPGCPGAYFDRVAAQCVQISPGERIEVGVVAERGRIHIHITNFGVEIPLQDLPHLFEKFYRVAHLERGKQDGTGLGLALVKKLVEHLGGTITIRSADGRTTFTLSLPSVL